MIFFLVGFVINEIVCDCNFIFVFVGNVDSVIIFLFYFLIELILWDNICIIILIFVLKW